MVTSKGTSHRIQQAVANNGVAIGIGVILVIGLSLGFGLEANGNIPAPYNRISSIIGWVYFSCWSVSFWPQVYLNWRRQSVVGLSLDFEVYNMLGFLCYTVFNCAIYWNNHVQEEYMKLHGGHRNVVEVNDVFFAIHATVLTGYTLFQCLIYPRGDQIVSRICVVVTATATGLATLFGLITAFGSSSMNFFTVLNFLYFLSYIKLGISLIKFIPQVILNYQRKSTVGWTIWNVLLDFTGGWLSVAQIVMDSAVTNDWSAISGDPVKFALGFVSVFFDIIFMVQHYVLYAFNNQLVIAKEEEKLPLITK